MPWGGASKHYKEWLNGTYRYLVIRGSGQIQPILVDSGSYIYVKNIDGVVVTDADATTTVENNAIPYFSTTFFPSPITFSKYVVLKTRDNTSGLITMRFLINWSKEEGTIEKVHYNNYNSLNL